MHALASTDAAPTAPAERRSSGLVVAAAIGLVALVVIAVVSWTQGAVELPVHRHQRHGLERWLYFTAIAVLAFAWLGVLRAATDGRVSTRAAQLVGLLWSLPLLAAAPLGSRDAYAYVAQGNVLAHGLNPYRVGPAAVHDVFRTQVSAVWRHSTSPYGALWTEASRLVVAVAGPHPLRAAMTIRLFAFAGIVVLLLTLPRLARLAGGSPVRAVTLFALNPYVLVVGLGGAHNDVVMLGLMALGLWLALDRPGRWSLAVGAAVITVGAAVKLPAVIVLPFLPLLWVRVRKPAGRRPLADAGAVTLLSAGATAAVITLVTGFPEGWHPLSGQVVSWLGWLSLPLDLVYVVRYIDGYSHAYIVTVGHHLQHQLATAALGLTAVVLVGCWLAALRGRPWAWLAAALGGAVLCSTAVESWYLLWPFFVVALLARRRRDLAIIAAVSLGFVFGMGPEGYAITHNVAAVPLFGIAGAAAALWLRRWDLARPAAGSVTPPPSGAPR